MRKLAFLAMLSLGCVLPAGVALAYQPPPPPYEGPPPYGEPPPRWGRVPNLNGTWFNGGDEDQPTRIIQRPGSTRALFINENGSRARGFIRGNSVFIPDWSAGDGEQGLRGVLRGDRIIWPNGTYWSR